MQFNEHFIQSALHDVQMKGTLVGDVVGFSVDSRSIELGEIFVALQGSQTDGHNFIAQALTKGAGVIVAAEKASLLDAYAHLLKNKLLIIVADPLQALFTLAREWRAQFNVPIMAVTGSVGKTSTKEQLALILRFAGKKYLISQGNQNTIIGACLNILRLRSWHEGAILELGVNKRAEMERIVSIVKPTSALITNIGHCHMEGIGSLHDIALEKRDVFKYFLQDSIGIINGDSPLLSTVSYPHPMIRFGSKTTNQIQARKIRVAGGHISFVLKIYKAKFQVLINHPHISAVFNLLGATAAAYLLGVPVEQIVAAIKQPFVVSERFEICKPALSKGIIINDAYNANPESMKASLLAFQQLETHAPKVAVLGDMLELGVNSPFWHRQLGRFLRKVPSLKHLVLVGTMVKWAKKTLPATVSVQLVPSWQDAVSIVREHLDRDSMVLVKGSLGTGLRELAKELIER